MAVGIATGSIVATAGEAFDLSSLFIVTPGAGNPQYLIVSGLDRNEYTATSTGSTGTLSGNGHTTGFASLGDDSLGAGIVFTYNAGTGQYTNSTYGNLANVVLTASHDTDRNESISLFAANSASSLSQYANNSYALSQFTTYLGSVSVVTQPTSVAQPPVQATPTSIAHAAMSFVGQAWNMDGCWVLASDIAAEAGASLPLSSTSLGIPGVANGEWIVAYDGPAGQTGNWEANIKAGEMVAFETSSTTGHITTVVSGSGASAMLVDNITYEYSNGTIANAANDGSANDVVVAAPHAASQEWAQAMAGSVVVYELDTPTVTATTSSPASVAYNGTLALSGLFTASDPANHAITEYQVYDTGTLGASSDAFLVNGTQESAHSAAAAITLTAGNLTNADLEGAGSAGIDTLDVRAYNGSYWGDWQSLSVDVDGVAQTVTPSPVPAPSAPAPSFSAPVVTAHTGNQVWFSKRAVNFTLPGSTFSDPQGLGMTYAAYQIGGPATPWLQFNGATDTFSGSPRRNASAMIELAVVATDAAGLSVAEAFNVTLAPTAARFAHAIATLNRGVGAGTPPNAPPPVSVIQTLFAPVA